MSRTSVRTQHPSGEKPQHDCLLAAQERQSQREHVHQPADYSLGKAGIQEEDMVPVHEYLALVVMYGLEAGRFARVPKTVILQLGRHPGLLALYTLLMNYVRFDNTSSECFPGIDKLAAELGTSESTIYRRLSQLRDRGFVKIGRKRGRRVYTLYAPTTEVLVSPEQVLASRKCGKLLADLQEGIDGPTCCPGDPNDLSDVSTGTQRESRKRASIKRPSNKEMQGSSFCDCPASGLTDGDLTADDAAVDVSLQGNDDAPRWNGTIARVGCERTAPAPASSAPVALEEASLSELVSFLERMPDPCPPAVGDEIAEEIVRIVGSVQDAVYVLNRIARAEMPLRLETKPGARREANWNLMLRAATALNYIERRFAPQDELV